MADKFKPAPQGAAAFDPNEWISAAETIRLAKATLTSSRAAISLATRAYAGLLRTWAEHLTVGDKKWDRVEIPESFWWANGHEALTQNWEIGDFETYLDQSVHVTAFGVRFHRGDLQRMLPNTTFDQTQTKVHVEEVASSGRRMSELWPEWVAELVHEIHEHGLPPGMGSQGQNHLIDAVANRLAERGSNGPSRTTVQPVVKAVLRRGRSAGN